MKSQIQLKRLFCQEVNCKTPVFVLGMGYLSTKEDLSDWYKEIVNIIGQGSFLLAAVQFRKSGLGEIDAFKSFKK